MKNVIRKYNEWIALKKCKILRYGNIYDYKLCFIWKLCPFYRETIIKQYVAFYVYLANPSSKTAVEHLIESYERRN